MFGISVRLVSALPLHDRNERCAGVRRIEARDRRLEHGESPALGKRHNPDVARRWAWQLANGWQRRVGLVHNLVAIGDPEEVERRLKPRLVGTP